MSTVKAVKKIIIGGVTCVLGLFSVFMCLFLFIVGIDPPTSQNVFGVLTIGLIGLGFVLWGRGQIRSGRFWLSGQGNLQGIERVPVIYKDTFWANAYERFERDLKKRPDHCWSLESCTETGHNSSNKPILTAIYTRVR